MVKIKELTMMVYRKYTKDFDSLGFRLGVTVDLEGGDPRDSWYQGRLFLGERIKEEERLIMSKFGWLAKKKKIGVKSEFVKGVELGSITKELEKREKELVEIPKLMEIPKAEASKRSFVWVEDVDDACHRIMFETDVKKNDIERQIERAKGMGINVYDALAEFAGDHGVCLRFRSKVMSNIFYCEGCSNKMYISELDDRYGKFDFVDKCNKCDCEKVFHKSGIK